MQVNHPTIPGVPPEKLVKNVVQRHFVWPPLVILPLLGIYRLVQGSFTAPSIIFDLIVIWMVLLLNFAFTRALRRWVGGRAVSLGFDFLVNFLVLVCGWFGLLTFARLLAIPEDSLMFTYLVIVIMLWAYSVVHDNFELARYGVLHLRSRLSQSKAHNRKLESLVKKTEYRSLMARTSPHFLFNTLSGIRALIRDQPQDAEQAITDLAELFRLTHHEIDKRRVVIDDELAVVERYFALQKLRFGERLRFTFEVSPSELKLNSCPPFLIQPLVENSIQHAVEPSPDGGEVRVRVFASEQSLFIRVEDSGFYPTLRKGTGSALQDMKKRLLAIYAEQAKMGWEFSKQGSFVQIEFPLEWSEHEKSFFSITR